MSFRFYWLSAVIIFLMAGCSKELETDLLRTIPADNGFVAVINTENLPFDSSAESPLLRPGSPLSEVDAFILFSLKGYPVATFRVPDVEQLKAFAADQGMLLREAEGDISASANGDLFICRQQAWLAPAHSGIEASDIKALLQLPEKESAAADPVLTKATDGGADFRLVGSLGALIQSQMQEFNLILNVFFNNPKYVDVAFDFDKNVALGKLEVLNSKGERAACSFTPVLIDVDALKNSDAKGNLYFALGVDSQLTDILTSNSNMLGLPKEFSGVIKGIEGTVIAAANTAVSSDFDAPASFSLSVPFASDAAARNFNRMAGLLNIGGGNMKTSAEGNRFNISSGEGSGTPLSALAESFKGASLGLLVIASQESDDDTFQSKYPIQKLAYMMTPDGKSLTGKIIVELKEGNDAAREFPNWLTYMLNR